MPTKLGQNFLNDVTVVDKIIASANLRADDFVLEIGPGEGVMTEKLVQHAKKVLAIELDDKLIPFLTEKFKNTPNLEIIHQDVLKINLPELIEKNTKQYRVIANIPYYITSPIIRLFLESSHQPQDLILMIQQEVAERIVAKPGKMSILSNSVQYYANAEILFTVPREKFTPTPKVDSAIIKITPHIPFNATNPEINLFFKLVRAGFSSKRKTLINNLLNSLYLDKPLLEKTLTTLGFKLTVRAQELSVQNWKEISQVLKNSF